ncbi:unnamed protein product [Discosporangium mesarthrocarpum]
MMRRNLNAVWSRRCHVALRSTLGCVKPSRDSDGGDKGWRRAGRMNGRAQLEGHTEHCDWNEGDTPLAELSILQYSTDSSPPPPSGERANTSIECFEPILRVNASKPNPNPNPSQLWCLNVNASKCLEEHHSETLGRP